MTSSEALNWGLEKLSTSISTSPSLDSEVLLCSVLKWSKADLISNRKEQIDPIKLEKYMDLIKERAKGIPVAYLTGFKEFYGLKFKVNKHVLIPRPETETLIERITFELKNRNSLRILDIGTGSGCIIVTLAKKLSNTNHYFGSDASQRALGVAEENAALHNVKVKFIRSDLTRTTGTDYDLIIANLPYLAGIEDESIKFEPKSALIAKKDGLELYEKLFKEISDSGHKPLLFLEFGHDHELPIRKLVAEYLPGSQIEIFRDLSGIPRFARIWQKA